MIQVAFRRTTKLMQIALVLCTAALAEAPKPVLTASEVMHRVIAATGAPPANTVDTLKAGDPNTVVTGIVTTFMDTYPVLEKAVASGNNLLITHLHGGFLNAATGQMSAIPVDLDLWRRMIRRTPEKPRAPRSSKRS
jgi:hypothetical protein